MKNLFFLIIFIISGCRDTFGPSMQSISHSIANCASFESSGFISYRVDKLDSKKCSFEIGITLDPNQLTCKLNNYDRNQLAEYYSELANLPNVITTSVQFGDKPKVEYIHDEVVIEGALHRLIESKTCILEPTS